jgi:hypothetical protein
MRRKNNDNNGNSLKTKWGNRFIIAAIIQGGIMTGMALATVAFHLCDLNINIRSLSLYTRLGLHFNFMSLAVK